MVTTKKELKHWVTLERRELLNRQPWFSVFEETVKLPDGKTINDFHKINMPETAVIILVDSQKKMLFLEQYKHGIQSITLTIPGGALETRETPLEGAKRELIEETGFVAESWRQVGCYYTNGTYGCGLENIFIAENIQKITEPCSDDLEENLFRWLTPHELEKVSDRRDIPIMGVYLAILIYFREIIKG